MVEYIENEDLKDRDITCPNCKHSDKMDSFPIIQRLGEEQFEMEEFDIAFRCPECKHKFVITVEPIIKYILKHRKYEDVWEPYARTLDGED